MRYFFIVYTWYVERKNKPLLKGKGNMPTICVIYPNHKIIKAYAVKDVLKYIEDVDENSVKIIVENIIEMSETEYNKWNE